MRHTAKSSLRLTVAEDDPVLLMQWIDPRTSGMFPDTAKQATSRPLPQCFEWKSEATLHSLLYYMGSQDRTQAARLAL